jgi:indolepyruvate ferredoxin oxidoreductase beta subunit
VNLGEAIYPVNIVEQISKYFKSVKCVDALDIARRAGNVKAVNTALLGALSNYLKTTDDVWDRVLKESFPEKALKANLRAFNLGKSF